jgi:inner membrane protein
VLERFGGRRLHPAQYGLVGLLLALFYLLLISLAERIGFASAYVGAAAVIAVMNGAYVGAALSSLKRGAGAGGSLALLYAAFYVMLMSEDDALLIGSGLLLLGVGLAMAATARIGKRKEAPLPSV